MAAAFAGEGMWAQAGQRRADGNQHFQAGALDKAAECYREALRALAPALAGGEAPSGEDAAFVQALRLNLSAAVLETGPDEAADLCTLVLQGDAQNVKALYRRAAARQAGAKSKDPKTAAEMLQEARGDLMVAARAEPSNRQVRGLLEAVAKDIKECQGGGEGGLRLSFGGGLYNDREIQEPPPPPVMCQTCNRPGHPRCGKEMWVEERAAWLRMPLETVAREPRTFEESGALLNAISDARDSGDRRPVHASREADSADGARAEAVCEEAVGHPAVEELSDLSQSEAEKLEDCLYCTERPYPQPKRPLPLAVVIRCAEEIWADQD